MAGILFAAVKADPLFVGWLLFALAGFRWIAWWGQC